MKKIILSTMICCTLAALTFFYSGCQKSMITGSGNSSRLSETTRTSQKVSSSNAKVAPDAGGPVSQSNFNLWQTCSVAPAPYDIQGTNGICVPVGGTGCGSNDQAAQEINGQYASGMQFNGCFKGGSNAPDGSNEMAVFIADNVTQWDGDEMGFVETLSDHTLKAYIQGNGNYYTHVISTGDDGYHTFKCQVNYNNHSQVDFYVDGNYVCSLSNSGVNYWENWYYFVGTTHRTSDSWSSSGQQIEMYNVTTY